MRVLLIVTVIFLIIFCLGFTVGASAFKPDPELIVGTLHIETSDPDEPYIFLELNGSVENLLDKDFVTLEIDTKNYISQ